MWPIKITGICKRIDFCLYFQTVHENRIYSLKITCGNSYPDAHPDVQFISRVNLPFVNQTNGKVDPSKLPVLAHWTRNSSIEHVLVEIRKCVALSLSPSRLPVTHRMEYV